MLVIHNSAEWKNSLLTRVRIDSLSLIETMTRALFSGRAKIPEKSFLWRGFVGEKKESAIPVATLDESRPSVVNRGEVELSLGSDLGCHDGLQPG